MTAAKFFMGLLVDIPSFDFEHSEPNKFAACYQEGAEWDLILPARAKINLGLYVLRKRQDGYHDIGTIFQEVEFHDTLYFRKQRESLVITTDHPSLSVGTDNLVHRAVQLLHRHAGCPDNVSIHLAKQIPLGAGLGGGSSNAAATLGGLNRLFGLGLSQPELAALGAELGSDVPFFIYGGTAIGEGRGEKIRPLPGFPPMCVLLVNPGIHVATAWAYKNVNFQLTNFDALNSVLYEADTIVMTGVNRVPLENMLEEPVMNHYPILRSIKAQLLELGAEWAMMSGSGSTVFGIFSSQACMEKARQQMMRPDWLVVATRTIPNNSSQVSETT